MDAALARCPASFGVRGPRDDPKAESLPFSRQATCAKGWQLSAGPAHARRAIETAMQDCGHICFIQPGWGKFFSHMRFS